MKYAVIGKGGKQYRVIEGDEILIEKVAGDRDSFIDFNEVLLFVDDQQINIGHPFIQEVKVNGNIVSQIKDKKIRVATYKAKSRYRRVKGYRHQLTKVRITSINKIDIKHQENRATIRKSSKKSTK